MSDVIGNGTFGAALYRYTSSDGDGYMIRVITLDPAGKIVVEEQIERWPGSRPGTAIGSRRSRWGRPCQEGQSGFGFGLASRSSSEGLPPLALGLLDGILEAA